MTKDGAEDLTAALAVLVEVLLPGDELFPSGSALGLHGLLAERVRESGGAAALDQLARALAAGGAPFAALEPAARAAVVTRLERDDPALFELLMKAAYLSYYESPAVQDAIRALGFAYNPMPLPAGYPVGTFDTERDRPRHGRGRWLATDEVRRVDLSRLDFAARTT